MMKYKIKSIHLYCITILLVISSCYIASTGEDMDSTEWLQVTQIDDNLTVHFLDIGQADCILIQIPSGQNVLIDAGNESDSTYIQNYLNNLNIKDIHVLIQTHPHEDHIGSMDDIVDNYNIEKILAPKVQHQSNSNTDFNESVSNKGLTVDYVKAYDSFYVSGTPFYIFSPYGDDYKDLNYYSLVIKMTYGNTSFLFMGDAEGDVLNEIIDNEFDLKSDVLKVGHHGALPSTPLKFLQRVSPNIAVITAKSNHYGYPHFVTLSNLATYGVETHLTGGNGTVVVSSDGENISVWRSKFINSDENSLEK